ncbi:hypothetical protein IX84_08160 [Phaeodactylibacter xiamenensis]|uniref:Uncharacterized protein n=2 Tax=Phaeodactylibacter xiamenensis TaxID=1524460 RepID=A0A098SC66_9BACT|nr:hypothetical protein IX84_08160 [Phaeodactylibacter xiamenensis]
MGLCPSLKAQSSFRIHAMALTTSERFELSPEVMGYRPERSQSYGNQVSAQWVSKSRIGAIASVIWQTLSNNDDRYYDELQELRHEAEGNSDRSFECMTGVSYHVFPEGKPVQIELRALGGYRSLSLGQQTETYISTVTYQQEQRTYQFEQQGGWVFMPGIVVEVCPQESPIGGVLQISSWHASSQQDLQVLSVDGQERMESFRMKSNGVSLAVGLVYAF